MIKQLLRIYECSKHFSFVSPADSAVSRSAMGRNKKRKLQEQGTAAAGGSVPATAAVAAPVPNGQNSAEPPPTADPPPDPPPSTQQQQPFCEPLHNLADVSTVWWYSLS